MGIVIELLVVGGIILAILLIIYFTFVSGPERRQNKRLAKVAEAQAIEGHMISANHQEMYLVLSRLLSDDERGLNVVFLSEPEREDARKLCETFRKEIIQ
jgi:hypothetical protein